MLMIWMSCLLMVLACSSCFRSVGLQYGTEFNPWKSRIIITLTKVNQNPWFSPHSRFVVLWQCIKNAGSIKWCIQDLTQSNMMFVTANVLSFHALLSNSICRWTASENMIMFLVCFLRFVFLKWYNIFLLLFESCMRTTMFTTDSCFSDIVSVRHKYQRKMKEDTNLKSGRLIKSLATRSI